MWLVVKEAAGRKPLTSDIKIIDNELGVEAGRHYRRLLGDFPSVKRGPDESIASHYGRLKDALEDWRSRDPEIYEKRREDPRAALQDDPDAAPPPWLILRNQEEAQQSQPEVADQSSTSDLPRRVPRNRPLALRDPGWYTSPESQSAGYGVPPMDRRVPGNSLAPSNAPGYAPEPQSMQDWVRWLNSKGIIVDHTLQRPDAAQRQAPYRPLTGPEVWHDLVGPSTDQSIDTALAGLPQDMGGLGKSWKQKAKDLFRGRRASNTTTAYVIDVLAAADYDPVAEYWKHYNNMERLGWKLHESGSGNYWEQNINGKTHRLMGDTMDGVRGWTHYVNGWNHGRFYDDIDTALAAAHGGKELAGFSSKPSTVEDSSHHPESMTGHTVPMEMLPGGPREFGKYQTLSYETR